MRLISVLIMSALLAMADDGSGWRKEPQHPQLEYKISCQHGDALSILWRNGYPGAVSLKARVKSDTYDGLEDAKIAPGGTYKSEPETMYCSLNSLRVSVIKFSIAAPPPPPPTAGAKRVSAESAEAAAPSLIRFDPNAEKLPEIAPDKLAQISPGMKKEDVVGKLGPPASKLSIDNVESYQYRVGGDKIAVVRLSNGAVTEIIRPQ